MAEPQKCSQTRGSALGQPSKAKRTSPGPCSPVFRPKSTPVLPPPRVTEHLRAGRHRETAAFRRGRRVCRCTTTPRCDGSSRFLKASGAIGLPVSPALASELDLTEAERTLQANKEWEEQAISAERKGSGSRDRQGPEAT